MKPSFGTSEFSRINEDGGNVVAPVALQALKKSEKGYHLILDKDES